MGVKNLNEYCSVSRSLKPWDMTNRFLIPRQMVFRKDAERGHNNLCKFST